MDKNFDNITRKVFNGLDTRQIKLYLGPKSEEILTPPSKMSAFIMVFIFVSILFCILFIQAHKHVSLMYQNCLFCNKVLTSYNQKKITYTLCQDTKQELQAKGIFDCEQILNKKYQLMVEKVIEPNNVVLMAISFLLMFFFYKSLTAPIKVCDTIEIIIKKNRIEYIKMCNRKLYAHGFMKLLNVIPPKKLGILFVKLTRNYFLVVFAGRAWEPLSDIVSVFSKEQVDEMIDLFRRHNFKNYEIV